LLISTTVFGFQCLVTSQGSRVALVIGNGNYSGVDKLVNAPHDAEDIAEVLRNYDFVVLEYQDLTHLQMRKALQCFEKTLSTNAIGLFFYAGHGVQVNSQNYLLPVDFSIQASIANKLQWLQQRATTVNSILQIFSEQKSRTNIIILDACRNNPYQANSRGLSDNNALRGLARVSDKQGLAKIFAPAGSFIAFATEPENTSSDGLGRNGLFTEKLLKHLRNPELEITRVFNYTRADVISASNGSQIPWPEMSMIEDFYFSTKPVLSNSRKMHPHVSKTSNTLPVERKDIRLTGQINDYLVKGETFLYELGRPDKAIIYFDKALALNHQNAEVYYQLGISYMELFEYAEAIQHFKQAIKYQPNYPAAYQHLANSFAALGDENKAAFYQQHYQ
jgi:tetratricopeptide (TPR) repeat protein